MNPNPQGTPGRNQTSSSLEARLDQAARTFIYPPTPALSRRAVYARPSASRRVPAPVWIGLALVGLLAALMLVSPVRARVLEWLQIGAVRIQMATPTPPAPGATQTVAGVEPFENLPDLAGMTSLDQAAEQAPFKLRLPTYPSGLGEPQQVYLQTVQETPVVIMVWTSPSGPRLALYQIGAGNAFEKHLIRDVEETWVNGQWALWVTGPYLLLKPGDRLEQGRVVDGRTLIWFENNLTYRLETNLPLDEARKIAESLAER